MRIFLKENNLNETAKKAATIIENGGIVIAPFDTVYGIICDSNDNNSLKRIYKLKGRDENKTIGLATNKIESLKEILILSEKAEEYIQNHVPGKYTFIARAKRKSVSPYCVSNGTIGARIPDSNLILKIAYYCGGLIAQTSANKSGMDCCYSYRDLAKQFTVSELENIDMIIDGGEIHKTAPSTLVDLTEDRPKTIERK